MHHTLPSGEEQSARHLLNLPKVDLHIHQEVSPRLDRVLAAREGRLPYDWMTWATRLMHDFPPGIPRLRQLASVFPADPGLDALPDNFIARLEDLLEEAAMQGAILVEVRFGGETMLLPDYLDLFQEAERRVQIRYPHLHAEAIAVLLLNRYEPERLEQIVQACLSQAAHGLRGLDFLYEPYHEEAEWEMARSIAQRAIDVGLGITIHAGEFSAANLAAVATLPGVSRIGHAVFATSDQYLLDLLRARQITVECCLSCNVILGAVPSLQDHPIRRLVAQGIPVVLGTDDPVQLSTNIGQEYRLAHALGFSQQELTEITRHALSVAFTTPERRCHLLTLLETSLSSHQFHER
ncbi:hypothetical protein [Tengunoibacter tsumagoiensis]|uniref:Adenosine deaminase n=1 Tax=Tengunoibacter tsumagoiensis TaxID=2014871 RepID=A0A402A8L2_9CHLR|nr:hypothetical protein [Tengunoibacter tsumagoiensis]GCE15346.1 adenosine deaminase [Tengunoibacter tsumagoiensis]